jgi:hypothetical protein
MFPAALVSTAAEHYFNSLHDKYQFFLHHNLLIREQKKNDCLNFDGINRFLENCVLRVAACVKLRGFCCTQLRLVCCAQFLFFENCGLRIARNKKSVASSPACDVWEVRTYPQEMIFHVKKSSKFFAEKSQKRLCFFIDSFYEVI